MNYLVFLNAQAGELEKILSGVKTMLVKNCDPAQPVTPGDSLYFLKAPEDCALRVKATVVRVLSFTDPIGENLSHILKEMQPRLQLTEEQYNHWSEKGQVIFVEFGSAQKIPVIHVSSDKITGRSGWTPFEELSRII